MATEAPVLALRALRALLVAPQAQDAAAIRAQFVPTATQACGATGRMKSAAATVWVGVNPSGCTVRQEHPILAVVFGAPAVLAALAIWYFSRN